VCILDGVRIGEKCKIFPGAILGSIPQDLKFRGEESLLIVGNGVTIREYCTLNRGTRANYETIIGDECLIMAYVHVAHDCVIGEKCILANCVNLAGHIEVGAKAVLGGLSAVHQFVKIGKHVMLGGGSLVRKDVPPFIKAAREPLSYAGINSIGLKRNNFNSDQIGHIQAIYRTLYLQGYNTTQAVEQIRSNIDASPERETILNFISNADRGIIGFRHVNGNRTNGNRTA
ncbi:MAG: acyl-ACP--UDP-N-acetylglucosamine O-acyltransferase, partial [Bacteroidota bacterium]